MTQLSNETFAVLDMCCRAKRPYGITVNKIVLANTGLFRPSKLTGRRHIVKAMKPKPCVTALASTKSIPDVHISEQKTFITAVHAGVLSANMARKSLPAEKSPKWIPLI